MSIGWSLGSKLYDDGTVATADHTLPNDIHLTALAVECKVGKWIYRFPLQPLT